VISFRQQDYMRRELASLRKVRPDGTRMMTDDEIRELITMPESYRRWLAYEARTDPGLGRVARKAIEYRDAMLALLESTV
jgi:hypothetical protein